MCTDHVRPHGCQHWLGDKQWLVSLYLLMKEPFLYCCIFTYVGKMSVTCICSSIVAVYAWLTAWGFCTFLGHSCCLALRAQKDLPKYSICLFVLSSPPPPTPRSGLHALVLQPMPPPVHHLPPSSVHPAHHIPSSTLSLTSNPTPPPSPHSALPLTAFKLTSSHSQSHTNNSSTPQVTKSKNKTKQFVPG